MTSPPTASTGRSQSTGRDHAASATATIPFLLARAGSALSQWRRSNRLNPAPAAPEPRHSVRGPEQRAARPAWSAQGPRIGARSAPAKSGMRSVDRSARTAPLGARDALPPVEAPLRWVDRRGDAETVPKGRRGVEAQMSAVTRADQLHWLREIVRDGDGKCHGWEAERVDGDRHAQALDDFSHSAVVRPLPASKGTSATSSRADETCFVSGGIGRETPYANERRGRSWAPPRRVRKRVGSRRPVRWTQCRSARIRPASARGRRAGVALGRSAPRATECGPSRMPCAVRSRPGRWPYHFRR